MAASLINLADFGVYPDTGKDQTAAMIFALSHMGKSLEGIEYANGFHLAAGTYIFDWSAILKSIRQEGPVVMHGETWETQVVCQPSGAKAMDALKVNDSDANHHLSFENCSFTRDP
jgi:hypothetical protein